MQHIYSFLISVFQRILPFIGLFIPKLKEFYTVRKDVFAQLSQNIDSNADLIWVHAASLGEYEQVVPVLEELQEKYPTYKIFLTFFSPSGYNIKKDTPLAAYVTYLPLDTKQNAKQFLKILKPKLAIFVKYEFWPNFLQELHKQEIHTVLVSGVFRLSQPFFKSYGKWMQKSLNAFNYFFLQNVESLENLGQLGFTNAIVSGDTRFDRVSRQLNYDNSLKFVEDFKQDKLMLVCGSTWKDDEDLLIDFINEKHKIKIIIAPHKINSEKIEELKKQLDVSVVNYSEKELYDLKDIDVLIIDTIGLLNKIYSYADVAYVGGAVGTTGLHNVLEPATFNLPIITGTHIDNFPEAIELQQLSGLSTVKDKTDVHIILNKLVFDSQFRIKTGAVAGEYVSKNTGATETIMSYLAQTLTA